MANLGKIFLISFLLIFIIIEVFILVSNVQKIDFNYSDEVLEYITTSCVCKDSDLAEVCLYRAKGDDIKFYIFTDQKSIICVPWSCNKPVRYVYCD